MPYPKDFSQDTHGNNEETPHPAESPRVAGSAEAPQTAQTIRAAAEPQLIITTSRQFNDWLAESRISLGFTTYQAGKLFLVGIQEDGKLAVFERTLPRCMGMTLAGGTLYVSSLYQLWRFENTLENGQTHDGYDRLYLPQVSYVTGDLDIHDLAVTADGQLVFVNTLFSCLGTVSETHSFMPLWKPPFISRLAAEDRAHLNGLALVDGQARYLTAVGETDIADGWRDHRRDGGVVIDMVENEVVLRGLSMPHSPRVYRDRLWLHNSGSGYFGYADLAAGGFEPVAFCPGYLRGLAFHGDFAVVGLSRIREYDTFSELELDNNLSRYKVKARCGIYVIDLRSGDVVHWLRIEGVVEELYDVVVMPETRRPMLIGFLSDEIRRVLRIPEVGADLAG